MEKGEGLKKEDIVLKDKDLKELKSTVDFEASIQEDKEGEEGGNSADPKDAKADPKADPKDPSAVKEPKTPEGPAKKLGGAEE